MPLYEYECESCGRKFEIIQKFSDRPRTKCTECKGRLRKLISAPAIHFKGSGWYVTDYGKKDGGARGGDRKKPAEGAPPDKSESPSESAEKKKKKDGSS